MGRKMVMMMMVLVLLAPASSARFEGVKGPGMSYSGFVGGERFEGAHGPMMRYDGYVGGQAYSFGLGRWTFIGGEVRSDPDFSEMVKAHQERFNLARSVFDIRAYRSTTRQ